MKKLLLIAFVFAATTLAATAQTKKPMAAAKKTDAAPARKMSTSMGSPTEKGTWLLGGSVGFESTDGISVFELNPNLGYFIKDKIAIGAEANFLSFDGATAWAFTPFVKPYFGQSEMGNFFLKGRVGVAGGGEADTELTYGGGGGYALFLNKSIALEFGADYSKIGDLPGTFGLGIGFQIHFKK